METNPNKYYSKVVKNFFATGNEHLNLTLLLYKFCLLQMFSPND